MIRIVPALHAMYDTVHHALTVSIVDFSIAASYSATTVDRSWHNSCHFEVSYSRNNRLTLIEEQIA